MSFTRLSLLFLILWINSSSSASFLSDVSDCWKVKASRDFPPKIWMGTENLEDEYLLFSEKKVRRIVNETRKFTLKCLAPIPITIRATSIVKDKEDIDQVKNKLQMNYLKDLKMFSANSTVAVEPGEIFHLEATCVTTCDSTKISYRSKIYTKEDGADFNIIYTQKISSHDASHDSEQLMKKLIIIGGGSIGIIILGLLITCAEIFPKEDERQLEDIQLNHIGPQKNHNANELI